MSDTIGALIDKLFTVDSKMWNNQELLYEIRRNDFEWFKEHFIDCDDSGLKLFTILKKCCDLNVQRTQLITEIDERLIKLVEDGVAGKDLHTPENVVDSHKSY
jgi:hypothetical protein